MLIFNETCLTGAFLSSSADLEVCAFSCIKSSASYRYMLEVKNATVAYVDRVHFDEERQGRLQNLDLK